MIRSALMMTTASVALVSSAQAEWSLADNLDRIFAYSNETCIRMRRTGDRYRSAQGLILRTVTPDADGALKLYHPLMNVGGEHRPGQFLLSGQTTDGAVAEFVVHGGTHLIIDYGLCDAPKAPASRLIVEAIAGENHIKHELMLKTRVWKTHRLDLPKAECTRVRLTSYRLKSAPCNWTGMVVSGDGSLGTADEAEALSEYRNKVEDMVPPETVPADTALAPSPHRVEARSGYDALFYQGKPFFSYAAKGHRRGYHSLQVACCVNTHYVEGHGFGNYWPAGAEAPIVGPGSRMFEELVLCQRYGIAYKTAVSLAHCTPFLPAWLVEREDLGYEGHRMRSGGTTHASIFKHKTLEHYKRGITGFVKPLRDQPAILVFSQEDVPSYLDDQSAEAQTGFREWLRERFGNSFEAFRHYVGGVSNAADFDSVPYPTAYEDHPGVTWARRLGWLKLIWVQETYGDFLANVFDHTRKLVPGTPLTQRYVYSPWGVYLSRRVASDYNYTFGHLTSEGLPNGCGVGRKMWSGIYSHSAVLPLPRGNSLGRTWSRKIRRGAISDEDWRINAFTGAANGSTGFEYSPFFRSWGSAWSQAALYSVAGKILEPGRVSQRQMKEFLACAQYMMHYDAYEDVAVFHDAAFNSPLFGGRWSQSKSGIYTLIRETAFHPDVLTQWDMTAGNLRGKKALVLAGTTSIVPEIQDAIRDYVRTGGTVITVFCADGQGFPGANSYAYNGPVRESTGQRSFEEPAAAAHLGDVFGIRSATDLGNHQAVTWKPYGTTSLQEFNELVAEGKWAAVQPCVGRLVLRDNVDVLATFEDGSPAVFSHSFGKGRAICYAFDLGQVANNLTLPSLWQAWSDALTQLGCRKSLDTENVFIEGGAWHDDDGNRIVFLINHDANRKQAAALPDGQRVELAPRECRAVVLKTR